MAEQIVTYTVLQNYHDAFVTTGSMDTTGIIRASAVYNAVWNDLVDCIEVPNDIKLEPGRCYIFDGKTYFPSTKYCQQGIIGIHSDTAGMVIGDKGKGANQLKASVAGYVLAYVDKTYASGTPLTCTKEGFLTKMKKKDLIFHPERIVATYWKPENSDKWNGIEVNGRHWVKIHG